MPKGLKRGIVCTLPAALEDPAPLLRVALQHRLALLFEGLEFVRQGALMAYEVDHSNLRPRFAALVDKVLRGASPATIPFELPDRARFAVNLRTARDLGIELPPSLLVRADEVVS